MFERQLQVVAFLSGAVVSCGSAYSAWRVVHVLYASTPLCTLQRGPSGWCSITCP